MKKDFPIWTKVSAVFVIITICFFSLRKQKESASNLKKRGRYTIGSTQGWEHNHRSSDYSVDYSYKYKGTVYKRFMNIHDISKVKTNGGNI